MTTKRKPYRPQGVMKNTSGGGHSAARYTGTHGVAERSGQYVYIRGEGWLRWSDIARDVEQGFRDFLNRRAIAGHYLPSFETRQAAEAAEHLAKRKTSPIK
jgi:hypothetical protein